MGKILQQSLAKGVLIAGACRASGLLAESSYGSATQNLHFGGDKEKTGNFCPVGHMLNNAHVSKDASTYIQDLNWNAYSSQGFSLLFL